MLLWPRSANRSWSAHISVVELELHRHFSHLRCRWPHFTRLAMGEQIPPLKLIRGILVPVKLPLLERHLITSIDSCRLQWWLISWQTSSEGRESDSWFVQPPVPASDELILRHLPSRQHPLIDFTRLPDGALLLFQHPVDPVVSWPPAPAHPMSTNHYRRSSEQLRASFSVLQRH